MCVSVAGYSPCRLYPYPLPPHRGGSAAAQPGIGASAATLQGRHAEDPRGGVSAEAFALLPFVQRRGYGGLSEGA